MPKELEQPLDNSVVLSDEEWDLPGLSIVPPFKNCSLEVKVDLKTLFETTADAYESIEPEMSPPVIIHSPLQSDALKLKKEKLSDKPFQEQCEEEGRVINNIREIAQAGVEFYEDWISSLRNKTRTIDDFIMCFITKNVSKLSKVEKAAIEQKLISSNWLAELENVQNFYRQLVVQLDSDSLYVVEKLYIAIAQEQSKANGFSLGANKYPFSYHVHQSIFSMMLEPLLTNEFKVFYKKIKDAPIFKEGALADLPNRNAIVGHSNFLYSEINMKMSEEAILLMRALLQKLEEKPEWLSTRYGQWVSNRFDAIKQMNRIVIDANTRLAVNFQTNPALANDENFMLFYWDEVRSNFNLLYDAIKELKEHKKSFAAIEKKVKFFIDNTLDIIIELKKQELEAMKPKVLDIRGTDEDTEPSKTTPKLTDPDIDAFLQEQIQKSMAWQETVTRKKAERDEARKIRQNNKQKEALHVLDKDTIDIARAQQLVDLYKKLDKEDQLVYEALFKTDVAAKSGLTAHNIKLTSIKKLIKNIGGNMEEEHATSHFAVGLPDTHYTWEVATQRASLSYMAPRVTGGSYKPHKNKGESWSEDASKYLRKAFEKAGLTPERFSLAAKKLAAEHKSGQASEVEPQNATKARRNSVSGS